MPLTVQKKKIVVVLLVLITLGQFGVDLYLPSLPFIGLSLKSTLSAVKLTVPLYLLGLGISQLFYGPASDYLGRKPVLHFGLTVFLVGSIGTLFSTHVITLIVFRTIQGLGAGAAAVIVRAILRDTFHGKEMAKVSAWGAIAWSATPIVAPVIGGYIQSYLGWRANFAGLFGYGLVIWLLVYFIFPETLLFQARKIIHLSITFRTYKKLFLDKLFLSFSLMSALCFSYFISFATASPFLFQIQLGFNPIEYGWVILAIATGTAFGSWLCGLLVKRIRITQLILMGTLLMLISTLAMFFLAFVGIFNTYSILLPPLFATMGGGMVFPNCTTGALIPHKSHAGLAGAAFGFIQMLLSFIFSWIVSHLPTRNAFPLSIELLLISFLLLIVFIVNILPSFQEETGSIEKG